MTELIRPVDGDKCICGKSATRSCYVNDQISFICEMECDEAVRLYGIADMVLHVAGLFNLTSFPRSA